jgi:polyribonucleotide nucleotidyltransferase
MTDTFEIVFAGRNLKVEANRVARQANGAVLVHYGDTVILATATCAANPREGIDFFPLTVDYEERFYAVGKIPGGFIKREGRPSEKAILSARLIDRPLRPLFPKGFRNDVHVVATVLSVDQDNPPEIAALFGASCALSISDIPFSGPVGAVIVGLIDGQFVINPTVEQEEKSELHLVLAGTKDAILMVEAGAKEVSEARIIEAMQFGHQAVKELIDFQMEISTAVGKPKFTTTLFAPDPEVEATVRDYATEDLAKVILTPEKLAREDLIEEVKQKTLEHFSEQYPEQEKDIKAVLDTIVKEKVRQLILEDNIRPDGRKPTEIRPLNVEVGILPRVHGTGLFTRGQTQVLTALTLGAASDEQILDGLGIEESKRFLHHYNFPPYSVGEARSMRGPGRREIGHGALAERALEPVIPHESEFPYTIRLVSDVLESNGSSSMASVCGSTLALMDGGVPIKAPVAGIAMGLISEGGKYKILTDIQGMEDFLGDMDFKVAGTAKGITALQLDSKINNLSDTVLIEALEQARQARIFVLDKMLSVINEPRANLSPYAPRIIIIEIDPEKIRDVIGPGGKTVRKIIEDTGVKIDIEDDGKVFIASVDEEAGNKAVERIRSLTRDVEVGGLYNGKVTKIMNFGAFVEILPGKEGLVHISQLAPYRVKHVEDEVKVGDEILVKVTEIDSQGRINLSRKQALNSADKHESKKTKA